MSKKQKIFSGDNSRQFWKEINALSDHFPTVWVALYSMGCKLQELEHLVRKQKEEIDELKKG